jgi:hypothetical protein
VQGNNTEFPTDARLYLQVINKCNAIAKEHGVKQRQTYTETSKNLMREMWPSTVKSILISNIRTQEKKP